MLRCFKIIWSYLLAGLVLLGSTSFTVGVHFCNGSVKALSFVETAKQCTHQKEDVPPCHSRQEKNCCDDVTVVHNGTGFEHTFTKLDLNADPFIIECATAAKLVSEIVPSFEFKKAFTDYDIPIRSYDRIIVLQSFLI